MTTRRIDRNEVYRRIRQGQTQAEVAAALGCTPARINHITAAVRSGASIRSRIAGVSTGGGMFQLVRGLPEPQAQWLLDQVPPGATLTETLRAIIADAWAEDAQQEDKR